jgi:hypothetical protein
MSRDICAFCGDRAEGLVADGREACLGCLDAWRAGEELAAAGLACPRWNRASNFSPAARRSIARMSGYRHVGGVLL